MPGTVIDSIVGDGEQPIGQAPTIRSKDTVTLPKVYKDIVSNILGFSWIPQLWQSHSVNSVDEPVI